MKPSPSRPDAIDPATADDDFDRPADEAPLTPEERARLIGELEAELEAAERSIREEGTISAEEFLKQRADYWARVAREGEGGDHPRQRKRR